MLFVIGSLVARGAMPSASTSYAASDTPTASAAIPIAGDAQVSQTPAQTEGPYFKTGSPETQTLAAPGTAGTPLTLTGQVVDANGQPVAGALLDFWQADAGGSYDNSGYTMRGHQYTDPNGQYTLQTVVPGLYPGRTRHIHVKVQAPGGPVLTTQLYVPDEPRNARDGIFNLTLQMNVTTNADGSLSATYTFVVVTV